MSSNTSLDSKDARKLARRLKNEDSDQFHTLVRMHLSFVLDLNVDESENLVEKSKNRTAKWGLVPFKKVKGTNKSDGESLTDELVNQVKILITFLSENDNLEVEGIFRRSGKLSRQQELKILLAKGKEVDLHNSQFSVHDCASVLKTLLSELPEPLLSEAHHPAYCHIAELSQNSNWLESHMLTSIQLLIQLLPYQNQALLEELINLLSKTAGLADSNRMSPENLATLFTPHLLCPRKLSAEVFHANSKTLSCIVVYMINEGMAIFEVPLALSTDITAYWDQRWKNPTSGGSEGAAKTVFSFVDRERTAQENAEDATETALAQLYAHIQSLPESNKKKRLIKQFNKENGYSTPRSKSITYSIRKHIFTKCQKGKDMDDTVISTSTPVLQSCTMKKSLEKVAAKEDGQIGSLGDHEREVLATSTPGGMRTPSPRNFNQTEMSPITRSTQRMPKAMQEAMATPRSRKPVIALSGSNLCQLNASNDLSWPETMSSESLTTEFKDYLYSRSVVASSPVDLSFSSQAGDFDDSWANSDSDTSPSAKRRCSEDRPPITESSL